MIKVLLVCLVCGYSSSASGIPPESADSAASSGRLSSLTVECSIPGVRVFLDSAMIGIAPLTDSLVERGSHVLRFVHPEGNNWLHPAMAETLSFEASSNMTRTCRFPAIYHITSEPSGARVLVGDSLLGATPLYTEIPAGTGVVRLSREGFVEAQVPLSSPELFAPLSPLPGTIPPRSPFLSYEQSKNSTPLVLAAGATVLTGAAAAYWKIRADGVYNDYQQSGDARLLDDVRRFDAYSGISLAASQISLLILSYLLFSH